MVGFDIVSSSMVLYGLVAVGLLYVIFFCIMFMKKAYARCLELGISSEKVKGVVKSSVVFSIVPSFAIVVGFISLAAALGVPWSWWRLSIIGSVSYELMAADMAAKGVGYANLSEMAIANDPMVFGAIMIIMSLGIMGGMVFLIFAGKKYTTGIAKSREVSEENPWGVVMSGSFMLTMVAVFLPVMVFTDAPGAATLATSAVITVLLSKLAKKAPWLNNFILAITLIVSMLISVVWQQIF